MTTTVTLETHSWPVEVKQLEYHEHDSGSYFGKRIDIVPPNTKRQFCCTQTMRLNFTEMPLPDQAGVAAPNKTAA